MARPGHTKKLRSHTREQPIERPVDPNDPRFNTALARGEIIRALREKDAAALQSVPREQLNSGSSEIRNWICAAGALEHLDLSWVSYCPGYRTPAGTGTGLCFASWS